MEQAGLKKRVSKKEIIDRAAMELFAEPWFPLFGIPHFQNLQGNDVLDEKKRIYDYIIDFTRHSAEYIDDIRHNCRRLIGLEA